MTDVLQTTKELAKTNPYIKKMLDEQTENQTKSYDKKTAKLAERMNKLAEIYQEPAANFILMDPNRPTKPLNLPPAKNAITTKDPRQTITEQKQMLQRLQATTPKDATKPLKNAQIEPQTTKTIEHPPKRIKAATNANTRATEPKKRRGRPPKRPTLAYYSQISQKNLPNQTDQTKNPTQPYQTENLAEYNACTSDKQATNTNADTSISTSIRAYAELAEQQEQAQKISTSTSSQDELLLLVQERERIEKVSTLDKSSEKVSRITPDHPKRTEVEVEKVSRATPVIYGERKITSKTTYTLVQIYSQELTPEQIQLMLFYREELQLTHAELTALNLLATMESNSDSRKQYWKIQETIERQKKQITATPVSNASLLDQKLAQAEEAIFGEIVAKPIDNNPTP